MSKKVILYILSASKKAKGGGKKLLAQLTTIFIDYTNAILLTDGELEFPHYGIVMSLHSPPSNSILLKGYRFLRRIGKTRVVKHLISPQVSISFMEGANFVNLFSAQGEKIILSTHTDLRKQLSALNIILRAVYKVMVRYCYNKADVVVAVSRGVAESLMSLGVVKDKIKIIPGMIDVDMINIKMKEPIEDALMQNEYLITVGSLSFPKGHWWLLRVYKALKERYPHLKMVIIGDGALKSKLWKFSESLGLKTFIWDQHKLTSSYDVYFLGFQENPFKYIAKAKAFVFSSLWEGFALSLVEALACGVPIISSDCLSGPREILTPNSLVKTPLKQSELAEFGILAPVFEAKWPRHD